MYHSILVGQDDSEQSRHALDLAIWVADVTRAHLALTHLQGRKLTGSVPPLDESLRALLAERVAVTVAAGIPCSSRLVVGWTTQALLHEARWYDLVVVGKRGASHARHGRRLGSLPRALLEGSPVPVLIADDSSARPSSLLVAFDETPDACKALRIAARLALERGLRLHVVEPVRSARTPDQLVRAKEYLGSYPGLEVDVERLVGRPVETVVDYIKSRDIHLTFLPAMDRSLSGRKLPTAIALETRSSLLVPEGHSLRIH